ncbi:hypothetical protein [Actinomadura sp. NEAU-AAG7]|uniref:hypothetical protein n=1 Tax=Actinomadura sp. NEAU-AAG7 TaxID=2839640 RepID=UPI001BE47B16|nr:hypothetical protein [Actinomadura sp. NEAU-AAG7]MBT2209302.1 hypothetical protein [Actinomadura sp. NEAU-AAG7]
MTALSYVLVWAGGVFRGAGRPARHTSKAHEDPETTPRLVDLPWTMLAPGVLLTAGTAALALLPGRAVTGAVEAFTHGYRAAVLHGGHVPPHGHPLELWTAGDIAAASSRRRWPWRSAGRAPAASARPRRCSPSSSSSGASASRAGGAGRGDPGRG